jgi:hypothetical protein
MDCKVKKTGNETSDQQNNRLNNQKKIRKGMEFENKRKEEINMTSSLHVLILYIFYK